MLKEEGQGQDPASKRKPNAFSTIPEVELALLQLATEKSIVRQHSRGWPTLTAQLLNLYFSPAEGKEHSERIVGALCEELNWQRKRVPGYTHVRVLSPSEIEPILGRYRPPHLQSELATSSMSSGRSTTYEVDAPPIRTIHELDRELLAAASGKHRELESYPSASKDRLGMYFAATNPVDRLVSLHRLCLMYSLMGGRGSTGQRFGEGEVLPILARYQPGPSDEQAAQPTSGPHAAILTIKELERVLIEMASGKSQVEDPDPNTMVKRILTAYFLDTKPTSQIITLTRLCDMLSLLGGPNPGTVREPAIVPAEVLPILGRYKPS